MENHKTAFTRQSISLMWLFSQGETFMGLEIRCSFAMLIFEDKLFDGFVTPYLHVYFLFLILQEFWFLYIKLSICSDFKQIKINDSILSSQL